MIQTAEAVKPSHSRWRRVWRWVVVLVGLWFLGDFCYSQYVRYRIRQWESSVPWSAEGLAPDAAEYTVGRGEIALLMVHGFSDSPQVFRKLAPSLAEHGFTCRAILLPGFGRDVATYAAVSLDAWRNKLDAELRALRAGHQQVWIVAHSLGGALSLNFVLNHPRRADGLVLLAPAIQISNERSPGLSTRFWHEFGKYALPFSNVTCTPFEMDARDPAERERPHRLIFTPRSVVDRTIELIDANRSRASEIQMPILFFEAENDQVVHAEAINEFYDACSSPRKRLVELHNSGHLIPVDYEWPYVVDEIADFIGESSAETN